jgi:thiamine-phosphate pyrophosphorylase
LDKIKIYRVLDVNINRVKEGLRVIEEYFRFVNKNDALMKKIRDIRHKLEYTVKEVYNELILARDVFTDEGKSIKEKKRNDVNDIVIANCKRAEEGVRVLEEYSKILDKELSKNFKDIRFKMYELEKNIYGVISDVTNKQKV